MEVNGLKAITLKEHFEKGEDGLEKEQLERLIISYNEEIIEIEITQLGEKIKTDTKYDDITFCQLILVEQYLNSGLSNEEKMLNAITAIFRPKDEELFDNENKGKESEIRAIFEGLSAGACLTLFDTILKERKEFLFDKFAGVIYKPADDSEEPIEQQEKSYDDVFFSVFGWYERQRSVAKELNMKMSDVLLMKASEALFELAYQKEKIKLNEFYDKQKKK